MSGCVRLVLDSWVNVDGAFTLPWTVAFVFLSEATLFLVF